MLDIGLGPMPRRSLRSAQRFALLKNSPLD
jgi:hypothetical protein